MSAAQVREAAASRQLRVAGRAALVAALVLGLVLARHDPFSVFFFGSYAAVGALLAIRRHGTSSAGCSWSPRSGSPARRSRRAST